MAKGRRRTDPQGGAAWSLLRAAVRARSGGLGFTLIELLSVIVMLGVLAMVVAPRFMNLGTTLPTRVAELRMSLRSMQLRALKGSTIEWGMSANASSYWAFNGTDPDNAAARISLPGEEGTVVEMAKKRMTSTPFLLYFDRNGVPYDENGMLTNPASITIGADDQTQILTITPVTGFIP